MLRALPKEPRALSFTMNTAAGIGSLLTGVPATHLK
jgi:hypothetical protein